VHRLSAIALLVVLAVGMGLRVSATVSDADAARCAIACGHAVEPGAACCPMSNGQAAAMASCPAGDPQGAVPNLPAQPAVVSIVQRLAAPEGAAALAPTSSAAPRGGSTFPPDHVPLLLS
jgi:hypothetical protein